MQRGVVLCRMTRKVQTVLVNVNVQPQVVKKNWVALEKKRPESRLLFLMRSLKKLIARCKDSGGRCVFAVVGRLSTLKRRSLFYEADVHVSGRGVLVPSRSRNLPQIQDESARSMTCAHSPGVASLVSTVTV